MTPAQRRILDRMERTGARIICEIIAGYREYFYSDSSTPLPRFTVRALISAGEIVPNGDGLFGDTQTFSLPSHCD